jgi:hypothetical protein
MRSFDIQQDLDFQIGGETFHMKTVRPEVLASWEDAPIPENSADALKVLDERLLIFLDNGNGQHERWKALREREDNALSMGQLRAVLEWMVEVQSTLPTEPPSPSARGRGKTATSSTVE